MCSTLTSKNFDPTVLESSMVVLVSFGKIGDSSYRKMISAIDKVSADYAQHLTVGFVHIDDFPNLATRYDVRSPQTLLIFKDGHVVDRIIGVVPEKKLNERLSNLIKEEEGYNFMSQYSGNFLEQEKSERFYLADLASVSY